MMPAVELDADEKFLITVRAHWIVLLPPLLSYALGWVLVLFLYALVQAWTELPLWLHLALYLVNVLILLVVHHWMMIYSFSWLLSSWVVTTKRIITFQFLPYVKHDESFVMIAEIHEIDKTKHGLMQNIFNYGSVDINLAAMNEPVRFIYMKRPVAFVNLVQAIHKQTQDLSIQALLRLYHD